MVMANRMILAAAVAGAALATKAQPEAEELAQQPEPETPPSRLSSDPNHADFHPSYLRVGVRIDGEPRQDVIWYDAPGRRFLTTATGRKATPLFALTITPFWRWTESRQERRARERWEGKHK